MLFLLLYQIGSFVALSFPISVSYKMASFIADIKYLCSRRERREIVENLKLVLPGESEEVLRRYARDIFKSFSMYLVDFFRFKKVSTEYIRNHVEIVNRHYLDDAFKKGHGVIVLSAHLGSWEMGGAVLGMSGYPTNVIALDHKNKLVNRFFVNQRRIKGERVISVGAALKRCFTALKNNELVAIVGDKDFTGHGIVVKFFGKDTLLPAGPAVFSLRTGAVIIPTFMIRNYEDRFKLIFERPLEYSATGNFEADVKDLTGACAKTLEDYITRYPAQWYCFRRFWQG